jgi:hypothetical protein
MVLANISYMYHEYKGRTFFRDKVIIDPKKTFDFNFPKKNKFSFIQVGGHYGISFDFLYYKVLERNSNGIILELSPKYFKQLIKNYERINNIILIQKAILTEKYHG